jgi:cephalosporin hydroxylase
MRLRVDTETRLLTVENGPESREVPLFSPEGFSILSEVWLKVGWDQKYTYSFSWMGRPMIQLPDDMIRIQEVIYRVKPDLLIETGVAHGGSLVFYASLFKAMGHGRVIGVDIEIRSHNRLAIEAHELKPLITLIEASSTDSGTLRTVGEHARASDSVMVVLDSNHSLEHVTQELELYAPLVTPGSYLVATDGIMEFLGDVPRGRPAWKGDNPKVAAERFALAHPEFVLENPPLPFNEGSIHAPITHWPSAYLRKR